MNKLHLTTLKLAAFAVASLLLGSSATRAQTLPSPTGDWDLVFSGSQVGLAVLTFNSDNTLSGYEIVRPAPRKGSSSTEDVDPRHPGVEDTSRTVVTTSTNSGSSTVKVVTNFLGSAPINGTWYYQQLPAAGASSAKIIGLLNQLSQTVMPVETYATNQLGEVVTNVTLVVTTETNAVSFRAVAVPNSRITVCTYGPNGNNVLRGKPVDTAQINQSDDYFAIGVRDGVNFVEFLGLLQDSGLPTRYDITGGMGPGYSFTGRALVSRSKQIAIVTLDQDGSAVLSVYTGSYNLVSHKGKLSGVDSSDRKLKYNLCLLP
jgi:hypothetical protein